LAIPAVLPVSSLSASGGASASSSGSASGSASASVRAGTGSRVQRIETREATISSDSGSESIRVTVEDGKVRVWKDGVELKAGQFELLDGKLTLDGEGRAWAGGLRIVPRVNAGEDAQTLLIEPGEFMPQARFAFSDEAGEAPKVMIGVHLGDAHPALVRHLQLDPGTCTMLTGVVEGLSADEAGLKPYDVIVEVEGSESADAASIRKVIGEKEPGDEIELVVIQAGKRKAIKVPVLPYDAQRLSSSAVAGEAAAQFEFTPRFGGESDVQGHALPAIDPQAVESLMLRLHRAAPDAGDFEIFFDDAGGRIFRSAPGQGSGGDSGAGKAINDRLDKLGARLQRLEELLSKLLDGHEG